MLIGMVRMSWGGERHNIGESHMGNYEANIFEKCCYNSPFLKSLYFSKISVIRFDSPREITEDFSALKVGAKRQTVSF